ncbi:MAG: anthranilate phosphoribosyltransferase [bacterium]|nr:anthranilate phosphoribosyltransferase [bacterium]
MIREVLERVISGNEIPRAEMRALIVAVMNGEGDDLEIAGLLAALRTRGETVDEVTGAAQAMRELAVSLPPAPEGAIDTCGTGGDGSNSFNISTVSALVVAGLGVPVAKHGNRAASSKCGSAEVLEALGVRLDTAPERMAECVREVGIGFLFARACHPAMARVGPIRAKLGVRTIFNRLGPLTNPMGVKRQLVGVADASLLEPTLAALVELGAEVVWVVHGEDGLDEISLNAPTHVHRYDTGEHIVASIRPGEIFPAASASDLEGGDALENAEIARSILGGERGPRRNVVLLNAGAALCVAGRAVELPEGARLAAESIDQGRARGVLERFVAFTQAAQ